MLRLEINAKDFLELRLKTLKAAQDIFEMEEIGNYDEGEDEWVHKTSDYVLDYEEGDKAHSYELTDKRELDFGIDESIINDPIDEPYIEEKPVMVHTKTKNKNKRK